MKVGEKPPVFVTAIIDSGHTWTLRGIRGSDALRTLRELELPRYRGYRHFLREGDTLLWDGWVVTLRDEDLHEVEDSDRVHKTLYFVCTQQLEWEGVRGHAWILESLLTDTQREDAGVGILQKTPSLRDILVDKMLNHFIPNGGDES